jgi:hypothetical protein
LLTIPIKFPIFSFELLYELNKTITSGKWVGDCFLYCNKSGKLNYSVGGEDRVYLIDKSLNVTSYKVMLAVLQYQTAVMRGDFDTANELLPSIPESEYTSVAKFLESQASDDYPVLLLLYSFLGNLEGMTNVAFLANLILGNVEACCDLLLATKRFLEAAFFARTYLPSRVSETVPLWKNELGKVSKEAAKALADPIVNPEMFPDYTIALQVENMFMAQRESTWNTGIPASD